MAILEVARSLDHVSICKMSQILMNYVPNVDRVAQRPGALALL